MKIEAVDLFYLSMPKVLDIADGSQDALLVRVQGGGLTGWGECEASPLVSIANWCCPMSHSACRPARDAVLGQRLESPEDVLRINREVRALGLDIAQTGHTLSGIDIALWDLLGKKLEQPVYKLLGIDKPHGKTPYASQLFGDTPEQTYAKAKAAREQGYRAVKFGWGPFGKTTAAADREQLVAAREGLGSDVQLLVDAGTCWVDDVSKATERLDALRECGAVWLEEPFVGEALHAYHELAQQPGAVAIAGGEGASDFYQAQHLIDHGGIRFIQIDTGRIGGITPARQVARYAADRDVTFVNHTFTTHLALSASLQPYVDLAAHELCEYPFEPSELAKEMTRTKLLPDSEGKIHVPQQPGLGIEIDLQAVRKYMVDVQIKVAGQVLYASPEISA